MKRILTCIIFIGISLGLTACVQTTNKNTSAKASATAKAATSNTVFYKETHDPDGRILVFGSAESFAEFEQGNGPELWKTLIGAGPNGATIKFQISKEEAGMHERLMKTYAAKHGVTL